MPASSHPLRDRFLSFVTEQSPLALEAAVSAFDAVVKTPLATPEAIDAVRPAVRKALAERVAPPKLAGGLETTPRVPANMRAAQGTLALVDACDGFLRREAIAASLTDAERLEILRGMLLTRAVDTRLKAFFTGSEVRYEGTPFQGKGFRSLGQEAIYAAPMRLHRGEAFRGPGGEWRGDIIGPIIRDLGATLAMRPEPAMVRMVLGAQMGLQLSDGRW